SPTKPTSGETADMTPPADPARYKNHRFPGEIISHGVWLYYRFSLSYRDVEEMMFARGIVVTHEAIRQWCLKFGQDYANQLKRRRAQPGDKWHLDEVFLTRAWRCWGKPRKSTRMTRTLHWPREPGEALLCASNCNSSSVTITVRKKPSPMSSPSPRTTSASNISG